MADNFNEKREAIMDAAARVFARYGYNKTTLDDIAEVVGIKKNSLYYYYSSKESLFKELIESVFADMTERINAKLKLYKTAEERILNIFTMVKGADQEKAAFEGLTIKAYLETIKLVETQFDKFICSLKDIYKSVLDEGVTSGEFIPHDTKKLAEILMDTHASIELRRVFMSEEIYVRDIDFTEMGEKLKFLFEHILLGIKKI